mgnify:CR=1 FL=1
MVRTSSLMAIRRVTVLPNMGAVSLGLDSGISKLTNRHSSSSIIQKPTLDSVQVRATCLNTVAEFRCHLTCRTHFVEEFEFETQWTKQ